MPTDAPARETDERLNEAVGEVTRRFTTAELVERLNRVGVPCGPIYSIGEAFEDPQVKHLKMTRPAPHKDLGDIDLVRSPINLSRLSDGREIPPRRARSRRTHARSAARVRHRRSGHRTPRAIRSHFMIKLKTEKILADVEGGIGWLTFNHPQRRNAVSLEMWQGIGDALEAFQQDERVRVVVMKGAGGKAFAAGADISEFDQHRANAQQRREYGEISGRGHHWLSHLEKPFIAMIQGFCIGGGLAIALNADVRFATPGSRFGIPAAKLGLGYEYAGTAALARLVGPSSRARHPVQRALPRSGRSAAHRPDQLHRRLTTNSRRACARMRRRSRRMRR